MGDVLVEGERGEERGEEHRGEECGEAKSAATEVERRGRRWETPKLKLTMWIRQ